MRTHFIVVVALLGTALAGLQAATPEPAALEECRTLFETAQHERALGSCMAVLRYDPEHEEARYYVRQLIDIIKSSRPGSPAFQNAPTASSGNTPEEIHNRLRKRMLLSMDLKSLEGVKMANEGGRARVEVNASWLFLDKAPGLKESGVPLLDRITSWLKTFGTQPIVIHIYPEELAQTPEDGSLFIQRYSELYNFFVSEKKFDPIRFVSAELLLKNEEKRSAGDTKPKKKKTPVKPLALEPREETPTGNVVVFESVGNTAPTGGTDVPLPVLAWIEFAVIPSKTQFEPEKGEWTNLDIAAIAKQPAKSWTFKIVRQGSDHAIVEKSGQGNVLQRVPWNGVDEKTGSLVSAGVFVAQLTALDNAGTEKQTEIKVTVTREGQKLVIKDSAPKSKKPKIAKKKIAAGEESLKNAELPKPPKVKASEEPTADPDAIDPGPEEDTASNSAATIWKQIIQFDLNQATLKPALKTSLERIGKTLEVYPLQKVRIIGFAASNEAEGLALAKKRAEVIRDTLINEFKVDSKRVLMGGGKVSAATDGNKAEMSITN